MSMSFTSIIGQDQPVAVLRRALANGALAHAYLFSGGPGIGKKMAALALGAAVNCAAAGSDGACGSCPSCRKAAAGTHPDIVVVMPERQDEQLLAQLSKKEAEKASDQIKIEQVRTAQERLSLKAFEGSRKVLIIDSADSMNDAAQNAFLKTLEEPPGDSLIVLISQRPSSLLATIRSRCQEVKFQPLPRQVLAGVLRERRGLNEQDAWFLAALSHGSVGLALDRDVTAERESRTQFAALFAGLPGMPHEEVLSLAEGVAKDRDGFFRLIDLGMERCRDLLVLALTGDERLLVAPAPERSGCPVTPEEALRYLDLFTESRRNLDRRVNAQLVAENLFLSLRSS